MDQAVVHFASGLVATFERCPLFVGLTPIATVMADVTALTLSARSRHPGVQLSSINCRGRTCCNSGERCARKSLHVQLAVKSASLRSQLVYLSGATKREEQSVPR